jgi:uncharacterized protein (DUF433 family)
MADTVMSINYIVKTPAVRSGSARLADTRLTVADVIGQLQSGATVDDLVDGYAHLPVTHARIYAALAYYHDHRGEIDAELKEQDYLFNESKREGEALRSAIVSGEQYIPAREASERLGLSADSSQVAHLCQSGKLDCRKVANRWFVSVASVNAYAAANRKPGPK